MALFWRQLEKPQAREKLGMVLKNHRAASSPVVSLVSFIVGSISAGSKYSSDILTFRIMPAHKQHDDMVHASVECTAVITFTQQVAHARERMLY